MARLMVEPIRLIEPDKKFSESYSGYVQELRDYGEKPVPFVLGYQFDDFAELILHLKNDAAGINLKDWQVPSSTFWLIDADSEIVAVSNLRHRLTENLLVRGGHIGFGVRPTARKKGFGTILLKETLKKARDIGIGKVLITCSKSNAASAGVIKNNAGVFQDEEYVEAEKDIVQRYWVDNRVPNR